MTSRGSKSSSIYNAVATQQYQVYGLVQKDNHSIIISPSKAPTEPVDSPFQSKHDRKSEQKRKDLTK